jgi:hypothetical protein
MNLVFKKDKIQLKLHKRQDSSKITQCACHNPIFIPGIFLGVGTQNEAAQVEPS